MGVFLSLINKFREFKEQNAQHLQLFFRAESKRILILGQKNKRTKDLFAMGKECRNVSHATMNCMDIWQWENKFSL